MWKDSTAHFVLNGVRECLRLEKSLEGEYKPRTTKPFIIPGHKQRTVMGVSFRDRVYQRSLNDNLLYPEITKHLVYDNCACQIGKGTDFARARLVCHLQRYFRKYGTRGWVLQCDIEHYYDNISHREVEKIFSRYLSEKAMERVKQTLDGQYANEKGYYPGSQLVQLIGITYLNGIDHYIKEKLRAKYYIRYMDDFILINPDKQELEKYKTQIARELEKLGLELHLKKTRVFALERGVDFLGFKFRLTSSGKVLKLALGKGVKLKVKQLRRMKKLDLPRELLENSLDGWLRYLSRGNTYALRKRHNKVM